MESFLLRRRNCDNNRWWSLRRWRFLRFLNSFHSLLVLFFSILYYFPSSGQRLDMLRKDIIKIKIINQKKYQKVFNKRLSSSKQYKFNIQRSLNSQFLQHSCWVLSKKIQKCVPYLFFCVFKLRSKDKNYFFFSSRRLFDLIILHISHNNIININILKFFYLNICLKYKNNQNII